MKNKNLTLLNKESKVGFLSAKEKELLEKILLNAFQNADKDVASGKSSHVSRFTISDIYSLNIRE